VHIECRTQGNGQGENLFADTQFFLSGIHIYGNGGIGGSHGKYLHHAW
jgi:hypothetical protein